MITQMLGDPNAMLDVSGLTVQYRSRDSELPPVEAVCGVSLKVGAGEVVGVIGESGCGKTSLLAALARLVPTTSGVVALRGEDYTHAPFGRMRQLRKHLQLVPQDAVGLFDPRLPVRHGIASAIRWLRSDWREAEAREAISGTLTLVGLDASSLDRKPHELSGGQIRRAALARALVINPSILLLDEPFSGLDPDAQETLVERLGMVEASTHMGILLVSHELVPLAALADRLIVMHEGKLVETGDKRDILARPLHSATRTWITAVRTRDGKFPFRSATQ